MEKKNVKNQQKKLSGIRFWALLWGMGLAGQLCWNMENQWFNTFVYAKISGDVNIVTWMVIVSALVTTFSTFIFGTMSDRLGKRKVFVCLGYIIWGCATILFGLTEYARVSGIGVLVSLSGFLVVLTDAIMSFFGSMGCDCGYSVWVNDYTDDSNKGQVGAVLAVVPVIGTVVGTVVGGILVNVGNPTVGTDTYDPSKDNYQLLFWVMGIFVIAVGFISLFFVQDKEGLKPHKEGSFCRQLMAGVQLRTLNKNPHFKEMMLACLVTCAFFIPFNFYFTHMGNWLIYDIGFTATNMGLVDGISLLFAALMTVPFSKLINKEKIPFVVFLAVLINALGLFLTFLFVKSPESVNGEILLSAKNIPAFFCVIIVGTGYVLIVQACTIWVKCLFPEENRGQLEGIRVMFFTLIPMFIGTLVGNVIIRKTPQTDLKYDVYGHVIDVPQENLFLIAGFMVLITLVPLYFAAKEYKKRVGQQGV